MSAVEITQIGKLNATVEWQFAADGGNAIKETRLCLFKSDDLVLMIDDVTVPGNSQKHQFENLESKTEYVVRVEVSNHVFTSAAFDSEAFATQGSPDAPTDLTVDSETSESVVLSWARPHDNGMEITAYKVYVWKEDNGAFEMQREKVVMELKAEIEVQSSTNYKFAVSASNYLGESEQSEPIEITT